MLLDFLSGVRNDTTEFNNVTRKWTENWIRYLLTTGAVYCLLQRRVTLVTLVCLQLHPSAFIKPQPTGYGGCRGFAPPTHCYVTNPGKFLVNSSPEKSGGKFRGKKNVLLFLMKMSDKFDESKTR